MMKNHSIKTFNTIASQHRPLANIQDKASLLQTINQHLQQTLPNHLQHQCYLATINEHTITVYAKNASSLTQLRFHSPDILVNLQKKHPYIKHIQCQIKPDVTVTQIQQQPKQQTAVSPQTYQNMQQIARTINTPELSEALQRLAKTLSNRS